ncbi:MAG: hypothetical protein J6T10_22100 [Methanobrevibacter sp.]|nr:hypothetical protein [Methanobrevibacter sp.]
MIEITWKDELQEELMELAEYIAFNNSEFICTTCLETLDRLKTIMHEFYGLNAYIEMSDMIDSVMEEEENE